MPFSTSLCIRFFRINCCFLDKRASALVRHILVTEFKWAGTIYLEILIRWSWLCLNPEHISPVKSGQGDIPRVEGIQQQRAGDAGAAPPRQCLGTGNAAPRRGNIQGIDCTQLQLPSLDNWHPAMLSTSNSKYLLISQLFGFSRRLMREYFWIHIRSFLPSKIWSWVTNCNDTNIFYLQYTRTYPSAQKDTFDKICVKINLNSLSENLMYVELRRRWKDIKFVFMIRNWRWQLDQKWYSATYLYFW